MWDSTQFISALLVAGALVPAAGATSVEAQEPVFDLLVSSRADNSVKRFDAQTGVFDSGLVPSGSGGLNDTQEVLLGKNGQLLVTGLGNSAVLSYDLRTGTYLGEFTSGYTLQGPTKTNFGPDGHLYVSQWGNSQSSVAVFDGTTGAFLREATPDLDRPMDQAWDANGLLHVVSFGARDIRSFDAAGNLVRRVVLASPVLLGPVNLWFQDDGMMVVDWTSGTIQRFGLDGTHMGEFARGLSNPEGWGYGPDGALYVGEWGLDQVRRLDAETGEILGSFASGDGLGDPNGLLFIERVADFSMASDNPAVTVTESSDGSVSASVRPERGVPFDQPIALSCSDPTGRVSCVVSPATVTPGSDTVEVAVTIRKVRSGQAAPWWRGPYSWWAALVALSLGGLVVGVGVPGRQGDSSAARRRGPFAPWRLAALTGFVVILACGETPTGPVGPPGEGTDPPPPPAEQTSVATVRAVGDGVERTLAISVTIR